jgi:uncharacterized membrane protein
MSEVAILHAVTVFDVVLVGALLWVLPRIARRGLLFGAFVGETASESERARSLRAAWARGILLLTVVALAAVALLGAAGRPLSACFAALGVLLLGATLLYLQLHRAAKDLAPARPAEPLPLPEGSVEPMSLTLPLLTLAACLIVGTWGVVDGALHWDAIPDRVPTHFGAEGRPDAWSSKSLSSVFALPIMNLVIGAMVAGFAVLTARARLSLRRSRSPKERQAQLGFRAATVHLLCGTALICSGLLAVIAHDGLRVSLGEREALGPAVWIFGGGLMVFCLGYTVRLLWFHGQGGSRREGEAAADPLTDGLADDRHWKLGVFYVNREDPAILIEKRFGLGYTLNFGNPWGIAILAAILLGTFGLLAFALWGAATSA